MVRVSTGLRVVSLIPTAADSTRYLRYKDVTVGVAHDGTFRISIRPAKLKSVNNINDSTEIYLSESFTRLDPVRLLLAIFIVFDAFESTWEECVRSRSFVFKESFMDKPVFPTKNTSQYVLDGQTTKSMFIAIRHNFTETLDIPDCYFWATATRKTFAQEQMLQLLRVNPHATRLEIIQYISSCADWKGETVGVYLQSANFDFNHLTREVRRDADLAKQTGAARRDPSCFVIRLVDVIENAKLTPKSEIKKRFEERVKKLNEKPAVVKKQADSDELIEKFEKIDRKKMNEFTKDRLDALKQKTAQFKPTNVQKKAQLERFADFIHNKEYKESLQDLRLSGKLVDQKANWQTATIIDLDTFAANAFNKQHNYRSEGIFFYGLGRHDIATCIFCGETFESDSDVVDHVEEEHEGKMNCVFCKSRKINTSKGKGANTSSMQYHALNFHETNFVCTECDSMLPKNPSQNCTVCHTKEHLVEARRNKVRVAFKEIDSLPCGCPLTRCVSFGAQMALFLDTKLLESATRAINQTVSDSNLVESMKNVFVEIATVIAGKPITCAAARFDAFMLGQN